MISIPKNISHRRDEDETSAPHSTVEKIPRFKTATVDIAKCFSTERIFYRVRRWFDLRLRSFYQPQFSPKYD